MKNEFNPIELRILGVLIEKSLTTPGSYPLTINAIVSGANQQQNRNPLLSLTEADVTRSLSRLQHDGVVQQAAPTSNARSNRYQHCASTRFNWDKREQAVMAELLLRSSQTAGELRNRAIRMATIPDMPAIHAILDGLIHREAPYVAMLQREPGRSTNRYQHTLADVDHEELENGELKLSSSVPACVADTASDDISERLGRIEHRLEALVSRVLHLEKACPSPLDDEDHSEV